MLAVGGRSGGDVGGGGGRRSAGEEGGVLVLLRRASSWAAWSYVGQSGWVPKASVPETGSVTLALLYWPSNHRVQFKGRRVYVISCILT